MNDTEKNFLAFYNINPLQKYLQINQIDNSKSLVSYETVDVSKNSILTY